MDIFRLDGSFLGFKLDRFDSKDAPYDEITMHPVGEMKQLAVVD